MNAQTLKRNYSGRFDRKAVDAGIFKLSLCRSPIDGRCGVGGIGALAVDNRGEQLRWRTDATTFNNNKVANDSNHATQSEWRIAA